MINRSQIKSADKMGTVSQAVLNIFDRIKYLTKGGICSIIKTRNDKRYIYGT